MTALEAQVSKALMRLRMIERAIHDQQGWTLHCAGMSAPATIEVTGDLLRITGTLPGACTIGDEFPIVDIAKDGEQVWSVRLDGHLGEQGTEVGYEFGPGVLVGE